MLIVVLIRAACIILQALWLPRLVYFALTLSGPWIFHKLACVPHETTLVNKQTNDCAITQVYI